MRELAHELYDLYATALGDGVQGWAIGHQVSSFYDLPRSRQDAWRAMANHVQGWLDADAGYDVTMTRERALTTMNRQIYAFGEDMPIGVHYVPLEVIDRVRAQVRLRLERDGLTELYSWINVFDYTRDTERLKRVECEMVAVKMT